jgi:hypothetical protein
MAPQKNPASRRFGGPGASHEDRKQNSEEPRGRHPTETKSTRHSGVSGGGGEPDRHHSHDPEGKAGD